MTTKTTTRRRSGPVPTLDLGVVAADDRLTYGRRHRQITRVHEQLAADGEATIRVRVEEDASVLARVFAEYTVRVRRQGTGWRVTISTKPG